MDVWIYLRKSRAEEATDSVEDVLKKHKDTLYEFAKERRISILKVYEEVVSGENLYVRTEMLKLLSDIEDNTATIPDAVLCMDIDRLGRGSMSQQGLILETFKALNIKIITPRRTYDLNNEADEEYTEFETFFARRELKTIKRRMQQGLHRTIQDGAYIANAPYGYAKCRIGKLPSLSIVENEADFVRMIFDFYANHHLGCSLIAERLNQLGAVPKRGHKFSRTTIREIIKNPVYIGKVTWNKRIKKGISSTTSQRITNPKEKRIEIDGIHPPIVDCDLFDKANNILLNKYHPPYYTGKLSNPLAGVIHCAKCGSSMIKRGFNHGSIIYLLCSTTACCRSTNFDAVEKRVFETINQQLVDLKIKAFNDDLVLQDNEKNNKIITAANKELKITKSQLNNLHDLLEQGLYTPEVFLERKKIIEKKIDKLIVVIKETNNKINNNTNKHLKEVCDRIEHVINVYQSANIDEKNRLIKLIVDDVIYYRNKKDNKDFILQVKLKGV